MNGAMSTLAVVVVLLLVCRYSSAQGGCTPNPPTLSGVNNGASVHIVTMSRLSEPTKPPLCFEDQSEALV